MDDIFKEPFTNPFTNEEPKEKLDKPKFIFLPITPVELQHLLKLTHKTGEAKKTSTLTIADINLLLYILTKINYYNTAQIPTQNELKEKLNLSQKQISTSLRKLIKNDFLIKTKEVRTYYINPRYFYLGKDKKNKLIEWKKLTKEKMNS